MAKFASRDDDLRVRREACLLKGLCRAGVPAPRFLGAVEGGFLMEYIGTHDLPDVLRSLESDDQWQTLVGMVVAGIAELHSRPVRLAGNGNGTAAAAIVRKHVGPWQTSDREARRTLAAARIGPTHGDLGPWNIRFDSATGSVRFLDWEDYTGRGVQALDLLNFVFTLPLILYPDFREIGFARLYDLTFRQETRFGAIAACALNRYAAARGVRPRDLVALFPVYCQAMIVRFERQGRSVADLFYRPFQQWFKLEEVAWLSRLETGVH
jgi:aminoglycoside phosphotransferase (APT) family kinase protein